MGPLGVVFHPPLLDHDLCLLQRVKNLSIQAFIPQLPVEALAVTVLPRTARLDVQRSRAVVSAQASCHADRQALPRVFIDHCQHADCSAVMGHGTHEVVTPDVIRPFWPQPHARTVIEPEPSPWLLFLGYLQPFTTPNALPSIFPHLPACRPQQRCDSPVTVTAILTGQGNDRSRQRIFIHSLDRQGALRSTPLIHQPASMPLGEFMLLPCMLHRTATSFRA